MEIIISPVVYIKTDSGKNIRLDSINSFGVLPKEDVGDNKNIIEAIVNGEIVQITDYLPRAEAEILEGQILAAQQSYTSEIEGGIPSVPPEGYYKVVNIFVDPITHRFIYDFDNQQ